MKILELQGMQMAYLHSGQGQESILFAHCSCGNHRQWLPQIRQLSAQFQIFAPDLLGYGQSSVWPDNAPAHTPNDLHMFKKLLEEIQTPVHLVAHSYGAAVALELARDLSLSEPGRIKSLFLIEPVSFHLLKQHDPLHWNQVENLARQCRLAFENGRKDRAAMRFMSYWIGYLRYRIMPARQRQAIAADMGKVVAEFANIPLWHCVDSDYASISCPVTLVSGARTRGSAKSIIHILSGVLPHSIHEEIPRAGHMSPHTHAETISKLLTQHFHSL